MAAPFNDKGQVIVVKQGEGCRIGIRITESYRGDGRPAAIRLNMGREAWDIGPADVPDLILALNRAVATFHDLDR